MNDEAPELTEDIATAIVTAVRMGAYDYMAAERAGVSTETYYQWLELGEEAPSLQDLVACPVSELRSKAAEWGVALNGHKGRSDIATAIVQHLSAYRKLAGDVRKASAEAECSAAFSMRRAWEAGDWRAADRWLSKKHPERWAQQDQLVISGRVDHRHAVKGEMTLETLGISDDQAKILGDLMAQAMNERLPKPDG